MMSSLVRLQLSYEGAAPGPATLVAKYAADNPTNREVAMSYGIYEREARFLKELAPRCRARVPALYHCELEADGSFLIVMEDLVGYRLGDQVAGADLADTRICLQELAALHASFWGQTDDIDFIPAIAGSRHAEIQHAGTLSGWPSTLEVFGAVIPQPVQDMMARYGDTLPSLQDHFAQAPLTLMHGDFRLENLFFGSTPDHAPLVIIDWQGPLKARGMTEVAFFLALNGRTDMRREHERALVMEYVAALDAFGVQHYDEASAWEDYCLGVLYNWCYSVVVSGVLDTSNAHARAWMGSMLARHATALLDLDLLDRVG